MTGARGRPEAWKEQDAARGRPEDKEDCGGSWGRRLTLNILEQFPFSNLVLEPRFAVSQLAAANHNSLQGDGDVVPRSGDAGNVGACMGWAGSPSIAVVLRKFQGLEISYKLRGEVSRRAAPVMLLLYIMGFSVLVPNSFIERIHLLEFEASICFCLRCSSNCFRRATFLRARIRASSSVPVITGCLACWPL